MKKRKAYVYIISNFTNSTLYTGVTADIKKRIYEHKYGISKQAFSKKYKLYKLLWFQEFQNIQKAIMWEKKIKGWTRKKKVDLIVSVNPTLRDLMS